MEHVASVRVPQLGRRIPKAPDQLPPKTVSSLKRESVTNNYGTMDTVILPERAHDSEYVVSFITGHKDLDRSFWIKLLNQSDTMLEEFDTRLHTLAEVAVKNVLRRTRDKFGRGREPALMMVQKLVDGAGSSMNFVMLPGGVVIPADA